MLYRSRSSGSRRLRSNSTRSKPVRRLAFEALERRRLLSADVAPSGAEAGNIAGLAEIHGRVWNDWNGNGLRDAQERGAVGLGVFLDQNHNGQWDTGEPLESPDATGVYDFPGLSPGVHTVGLALTAGWNATLPARAPALERVSLASKGLESNARSDGASISADGRYVAFASQASNLVPGDTNATSDIFVYDRQTHTIERVSLATDGIQANGPSDHAALSADGRYVAFDSQATNLVPGDSNGTSDVFVFDRQTRSVERVSITAGGQQANGWSDLPSLSGDGRYVAFESEARNLAVGSNGNMNVFLFDRLTQGLKLASRSIDGTPGNLVSDYPVLSADGRSLAFLSEATNLVPGDTNSHFDVFVYDAQTDTVERVSVGTAGIQPNGDSAAPSISADGRLVAFQSVATNLVDGDTNGVGDVFVCDRSTGTSRRVSLSAAGQQGDGASSAPALSADGRYLAFASSAGNLGPGWTGGLANIFVANLDSGAIQCVSHNAAGEPADGFSQSPSLSADGAYVAFGSHATQLVTRDANGVDDVFVSSTTAAFPGSRAVVLAAGQTAANFDLAARNPAEIYGLAGDHVRIARDATDPLRTAVYVNSSDQTPTYTVGPDEVLRWSVAGRAGNVGLVVDYSRGSPLPPGGLDFNGDPAIAGNRLVIRGNSGVEQVTLTGEQVDVDAGAPIRYSHVDSFRFELGGGGDNLTVAGTTLTLRESDAISPDTQLTIDSGGKVILDTGPTDAVKVSGLRLNLGRTSSAPTVIPQAPQPPVPEADHRSLALPGPSAGVLVPSAITGQSGASQTSQTPLWKSLSGGVTLAMPGPLVAVSGPLASSTPLTFTGRSSATPAFRGKAPAPRPLTYTKPIAPKAGTTQRRTASAIVARPAAGRWAEVWQAIEHFWAGTRRRR